LKQENGVKSYFKWPQIDKDFENNLIRQYFKYARDKLKEELIENQAHFASVY